jgi:hypothetical protein
MQTNQDIVKLLNNKNEFNIIDNEIWETIINRIKQNEKIEKLNLFVNEISIKYNIEKKNLIKELLNYIIRNYPKYINNKFLLFVENLMHSHIQNSNNYVLYSLACLLSFISE